MAPIKFKNPAGNIIEKVAVMGDCHNCSRIILEEALQPGNGLGIEMVGWFVKYEHVG